MLSKYRVLLAFAYFVALAGTDAQAESINTTLLCGNSSYCVYTSEGAFVAGVAAGSNALGQENFSNYTPGFDVPNPGPIAYSGEGGIDICSPGGVCGFQSNPVPGGSGNFVSESEAYIGPGASYIGFDYNTGGQGATFSYLGNDFNDPAQGFFGIITASGLPATGLGAPVNMELDNVLWAQGPGIGPNNPLYPDQQQEGGGCGAGKVCWFWYAVAGLADPGALGTYAWLDPSGANAYTYQTLDGSLITSIAGFPTGFTSPFDVFSGATDYGLFSPGQTLTFPNGGVSSFTISDINPSVDGTDPTAFPLEVGLSTVGAEVEATAFAQSASAPEPSSWRLFAIGCCLFGLLARVLRAKA